MIFFSMRWSFRFHVKFLGCSLFDSPNLKLHPVILSSFLPQTRQLTNLWEALQPHRFGTEFLLWRQTAKLPKVARNPKPGRNWELNFKKRPKPPALSWCFPKNGCKKQHSNQPFPFVPKKTRFFSFLMFAKSFPIRKTGAKKNWASVGPRVQINHWLFPTGNGCVYYILNIHIYIYTYFYLSTL